MQKNNLISSTGHIVNTPKLRFPEFEGEWEKKKLGEVFSISAGGDIESKNVSQVKTNVFKYPIYANAEKNKQSEQILEVQLISQLQKLGYKYITIKDERDLMDNLKDQLE